MLDPHGPRSDQPLYRLLILFVILEYFVEQNLSLLGLVHLEVHLSFAEVGRRVLLIQLDCVLVVADCFIINL